MGTVAQEAYAVFTEGDSTLTFYCDDLRSTRPGTSYSLNTGYGLPGWFDDRGKVGHAVVDPTFAAARPTSTNSWFRGMTHLTSITGINYLNTSQVTNMGGMFSGSTSLTSLDLSGFDTGSVAEMGSMFAGCESLSTLDLSGFNTSSVTSMVAMFWNCKSLTTLDVSGFNTERVTVMRAMFQDCCSLSSLDVGGFNTSSVTDMKDMFHGCKSLTSLDVSGFNTGIVTAM
jgi:surface protein